jgi:hypothetical protein
MQLERKNSWCMTSDQEVLGSTPSRRTNNLNVYLIFLII